MKKLGFVELRYLGLVIILAVVFFLSKFIFIKTFDKRIVETTVDLICASYGAESATNEYVERWEHIIRSGSGCVFVQEQQRYICNATELLDYEVDRLKESGVLKIIDSNLLASKVNIRKIDRSIFGNRKAKKCIKSLYINVSEYCLLAKSPSGSFISFNEKRNELSNLISRDIDELKLYMPDK